MRERVLILQEGEKGENLQEHESALIPEKAHLPGIQSQMQIISSTWSLLEGH